MTEKTPAIPFEGYSRQRRLDLAAGRSLMETLKLQRGDVLKIMWNWPKRTERYDLIYTPLLSSTTASLTAYYCKNAIISELP